MKNIYSEDAFTGLEAAIVLIAFVVVAAVFSYVVLGAGFFTSQTAQATVHTGVQQASSSLEVVGNIIGAAPTATPTQLRYVNISLALTAGGTGMDLSQMVVSYNDGSARNANVLNNTAGINTCTGILSADQTLATMKWCVSQKINEVGTSNDLLESNEIWVVTVGMPATATVNQKININLQPSVGAVLPITRTIPGALNPVQPLY